MANNFGLIIHDEVFFATKEMHDMIEHRKAIETLWSLCERKEEFLYQSKVAPIVRDLGYGNTRDSISSDIRHHAEEGYWEAIMWLLLLVLAAEGEELPS